VQQWTKDRDLLVEEVLAFAQGIAAAKAVRTEILTEVEPAKVIEPAQMVKPRDKLFEREEIRQRIAAFKANQNKFQREREEYYKATMANVR
jgi:hypothetical protein